MPYGLQNREQLPPFVADELDGLISSITADAQSFVATPGPTGATGADGLSAYESAVLGGYGGSESDFYTDLAAVDNDADLLQGQNGAFYRSSSNQNAGTLPDARFPATLPALSGVNLTALNATQLTSGTVPAGRFPTWTTPAFSAGDYTASGSMTWTVGSGDVTTFEYVVIGKTMTVVFSLDTTTVAGTPSTTLQIAIPGSYVSAKAANNCVHLNDNGTHMVGAVSTSADDTVLFIAKLDFANFTASTNATGIYGQITFEVQ